MNVIDTDISGVKILEPRILGDSRGYFFESFRASDVDSLLGCHVEFVQENQSRSCRGVVRGLHFQLPPHAQAKLVRVLAGTVVDVAVDLRKDSPTFGKHVMVELSAENKKQLFIPRGFAHGFQVISEQALFTYKVDNIYAPQAERSIRYNDPTLNIAWPITDESLVQLSEKDLAHAVSFNDAEKF